MIYYITNQRVLFDSNIIKIENSFEKLEEFLKDGKPTAVDTETTGLDALTEKIVLLQIGNDQDQFVIDLTTVVTPAPVKEYLESRKTKKILHNAKFDYKMLKSNNIARLENVFCTQQGEQLVMNGLIDQQKERGKFSLGYIVKKYLGEEMEKSTATNFTLENFTLTSKEIVYAAYDVKYTYLVSAHIWAYIQHYNLIHLAEVEMEANLGYADMELNGILLDREKWTTIYQDNIPKHKAIIRQLDDLTLSHPTARELVNQKGGLQMDLFQPLETTTGVNWNSPAQILPIMQCFLGQIESTEKEVLEKFVTENYETGLFEALEEKYKIAELVLNYRTYQKATSTYGTDFFKHIHPKTGRIHPNFHPLGPDTGRVSCSKPNLQNIKSDSDYRSAFVPRPGYKMVTCDYSGCELRIIAEFSGDPVWIEAFSKNQDVHSRVASMLFDKEVTKDNENKHLRAPAKNLNFGLAYGMGPDKLARQLRIPKSEAQDLMKKYFTVFPKIKKFLENNGKFAVLNGHILTPPPYNRIRWFKDHDKVNKFSDVRGSIERAGKNTPIQGCNADLVKCATVLIRRRIQNLPEGEMYLVNQVHDEFVLEVREEKANDYLTDIIFLMEMAANDLMGKVPMIAEGSLADCWQK